MVFSLCRRRRPEARILRKRGSAPFCHHVNLCSSSECQSGLHPAHVASAHTDQPGPVPHIRQIVMNLVTNASEAIGDRDGVIRLTTWRVTQAGLRRSRNIVRRMLRRTGFAVLEAADGAAAIELLRANGRKIDGILLDMTILGAPAMESLLKPRKVGRI